jgi:hypothetical protein
VLDSGFAQVVCERCRAECLMAGGDQGLRLLTCGDEVSCLSFACPRSVKAGDERGRAGMAPCCMSLRENTLRYGQG